MAKVFLCILLAGCSTWGYDNRVSSSFSLGDSKFSRESFFVGLDLTFDIAISRSTFNFIEKPCDYYLVLSYAKDSELSSLILDKFKWDNLNKFKHYLAVYPNFDALNLDFYNLHGFCGKELLTIDVPGFRPVVMDKY